MNEPTTFQQQVATMTNKTGRIIGQSGSVAHPTNGASDQLPDRTSDPLNSDAVHHAETLVELKSVLKERKKER